MVTALLGVGTETTKILVWVRIRTLLKQPTLIVGLVWEVNRLWKLCVWVIHLSRIHLPITAFILSLVPLLVLRRLSGLLFTPGWGTNMVSPSGSNGVWYALAWYWAGQLLQVIKCLKSEHIVVMATKNLIICPAWKPVPPSVRLPLLLAQTVTIKT